MAVCMDETSSYIAIGLMLIVGCSPCSVSQLCTIEIHFLAGGLR